MGFAKFFLILISVIVGLIFLFHILTRRFVNPYTFVLVFGKKGAGKSCTMQKDLRKHHARGWHCFADSNTDLPFVKKIDAKNLFSYKFPKNSFIAIDEVNLLWDNRDFKSFDPRIQAWFRQQRKHHCKVVAYSQTFDCDKKLRDLCDRLALQKKFARVFTYRRYYVKSPTILSAETTRDHAKIADDYVKVPIFFKGVDFAFIPKYVRDYNTDELKEISKDEKS